ncbi:MAG: glutamine-hydrolyzing carbamoyl-phosphate synthase small subunit [Bacteroidales bacterium]|jgi:carbamoyl-phosphate synthase small subunit|nr:glutamine-hydrolyzing carbamoyl-phosphate synthase small subunit [Bacteroidales bacterium]
MRKATLILDDGTRFCGHSFGAFRNIGGEVVFNTAMTGYPESLTDPSYAGQILVLTYPLIGNYGVPANDLWESTQIYAEALIVSDYSEAFSHWNGKESLGDWLKREQRPAITGIDTRALTRLLRERGVMMGRIEIEGVGNTPLNLDYGDINYVETVSCQDIIRYNEGAGKRVVIVDCGVKANIIRCLMKRGVEIIRVPWDYDFNSLDFDGLLISNGPGNPDNCQVTVNHIQRAMQNNKPVFGICMGNQLLAKASGATVYKLKYGHRSHNQPVRMVGTERCFITSQNHGYAVDSTTLNEEWLPLFENMNDGSNEGIRHRYKPWFSVQFHPEAAAGPTDTEFLFDEFIKLL